MLTVVKDGNKWWLNEVNLFESFGFMKANCDLKERNFYNESGYRITNKMGTNIYEIFGPSDQTLYYGRITNEKYAYLLLFNLDIDF